MAKNSLKQLLDLKDNETYARFKDIIVTSIIGIAVNIALGVIKIFVGTIANSVAVISDAVNNFSDSISSLVTIIAMAISGRGATRKHPFGFGRIEYFSSIIISVIVLITGAEFFIESVKKIIHPEGTSYTALTLILLVVAIVAKILLGLFTKGRGKKLNSPNLIASGQDALSDAIITGVTLVAAIVAFIKPDLHIDGWVGALVSLFVIKAGLEILFDVISKLMGERPDVELAEKIKNEILATEGILGAYDLILHNYGPNVFIGDVNLELDEAMTIDEAYVKLKPLNIKILKEYGVFMYFGIYSVNTSDAEIAGMREFVNNAVSEIDDILQIHAFYVNKERKFMSFDVVYDFDCKDQYGVQEKLKETITNKYPDYRVEMVPDKDYTLSKS
ncbi:MAG: cation transporter [Clostridia bacterium]|nr:cation transporter [Clostridia bacterium]MBR5991255.1 cation transporter [Clostridia bacterium]MBR6512118.1 cation transporter [Clostridia bacterium]